MAIVILFLPVIVALAVALGKKLRLYDAVLATCLGCAAGVGLLCLTVYLTTGMDVISAVNAGVDEIVYHPQNAQFMQYLYLVATGGDIMTVASVPADTAAQFVAELMHTFVFAYVPAMAAVFCTIGGLALYLLFRWVGKLCKREVIAIPRFGDFRIPRFFGGWSAAIFFAVLFMMLGGLNNFDLVFTVTLVFFGSIYFVQGMAVLEYWLRSRVKSGALRVLIILLPMLIWLPLFSLIGLLEQFIRVRDRADAYKRGE